MRLWLVLPVLVVSGVGCLLPGEDCYDKLFCRTFDLATLCDVSAGACSLPSGVVVSANSAPDGEPPDGQFLGVVAGDTLEISIGALRPQLASPARLYVSPAEYGTTAIRVFVDGHEASCQANGNSGLVCDLPGDATAIGIRIDDLEGGWGEPPSSFSITAYVEEVFCTGVKHWCAA